MNNNNLATTPVKVYLPSTPDAAPAIKKFLSEVSNSNHTLCKANEPAEIIIGKFEKQFRTLEEYFPGILYNYERIPGEPRKVTYLSPDPEKKIGISIEQLQNIRQIMHPEDYQRGEKITIDAEEKNMDYNFEGRFILAGKPMIWLDVSSSFCGINSVGAKVYTTVIHNITKKKEVEFAVELRDKRYQSIISNMNLGLLEIDGEDIIRFANPSFCEMSGYGIDELIGSKTSDLFTTDPTSKLLETKNVNLAKQQEGVSEMVVKNKKGETKWWRMSHVQRYNVNGEEVGSILIYLDITQQKNLENELIEAKEQAELSAKVKQTFLANMSHEIRTPMHAIMGMANQLGKSALNKDQQVYLDTIHSAADNLLVVINGVLDLSKLEAGKLTLENIGFEPQKLVEQSMQVMMYKAEEKGLTMTNSFYDPKISPILIGDPYRLHQVLLNLTSNAIKFTERGIVDIRCSVLKDNPTEQVVEFVITDTGIGMRDSFLKNLFQKFKQEDDSITRRFGGTGLGMSICKELIEFMGGAITVESKKGIGTTVVFTVPFKKGNREELPVKETGNINTNLLAGKKILITDDNEMNRFVAGTILKHYDMTFEEARNGAEAVEKLKNETFDIVLMDIQMPGIDGIEATRIIRAEISKTLPIIALTALAMKGDDNKFLQVGMNDYLSKPFEEDQLLRVLSRCLCKEIPVLKNDPVVKKTNALYDLTKLYGISRGNQSFVDKMVDMFIIQGPESVKEILDAYEAGDFLKVGKAAHRMKTSIHNLDIELLKNEVSEIEELAENNVQSERLEALITKFATIINEVVNKLK